ncbi:MAG: dockerin type I domain-containing protein [Candidatus Zixiibacteriota bacterium]
MTRKLSIVVFLSLLLFAFFAVSAFGMATKGNHNQVKVGTLPKAKLAGAERNTGYTNPEPNVQNQSLGVDEINSLSPGLQIGTTTYDYQSNCRMNRQVGIRGNEYVHFDWMYQTDSTDGGDRGTGYNFWDSDDGELNFGSVGCNVHPRLGSENNYSGYVGLDVDTEGKVNISNHHDEGNGYASTIWYDFQSGTCYFSPYRSKLPDSTMSAPDLYDEQDEYEQIWPSHEYQVWSGDTVTHLFTNQFEESIEPSYIAYFRRVGSDTLGYWEYPPMVVDTIPVISQMVTASRVSGKVALVWAGPIPDVQGDNESSLRGAQRENDLFYKLSDDMGATWGPDVNATWNKTDEGWWLHGDLSALYGTDDYLHVIWDAREVTPISGGTYAHFYGCRLFHWSNRPDQNNLIRVIKDANWDLPEAPNYCYGGAWNEMSIVKMSISECEGKMYAVFCQFNDIYNGISDDCHEDAFSAGRPSTANGEVWISVSNNWGFNWDQARNLTNSYTPYCNTEEAGNECDSDVWPSAARFGSQVVTGDYAGADVVDPSEGVYTGDYYLDVTFINDKFGGGCVQDAGIWTINPVKWIRVPCIDPVPNPVLSTSPGQITDPAWTMPNVQLDTTIRLENIGNAPLDISDISVAYVSGADWISLDVTSGINISHLDPNYYELGIHLNASGVITTGPTVVEGYLEITSTSLGGSVDSFYISLIVADHVQFPVEGDIRTDCTRIIWNNAGNIGKGGNPPDGGYNLNFFDDCDITENTSGANDNINVYLYDGSPFILRKTSTDTLLNSYVFDANWLTSDGLRPLEDPTIDSTGHADYRYVYTGEFSTQDTAITARIKYYAPTHADSCEFIVMRQEFTNTSGGVINDIYFGQLFDWDIPSDTTVRNGSDFDAPGGVGSMDVMWCYGGEYGPDDIANNDCILADQRLAGYAFYNGYRLPAGNQETDSLENPKGPWWTHLNDDWVSPTGNFVGSQLYSKMELMGSTWETWEATAEGSTNPDSMFQDLNMVSTYGKFSMNNNDTLIFVTILSASTDGTSGLLTNIAKARAWIASRPYIFEWPEFNPGCCVVPGDANHNGVVNILDITFTIAYLYKGGAAPVCLDEADANSNEVINILDITYNIAYLYKGGAAPICGDLGHK